MLFYGDCLEVLPKIKQKVDLVVVDLPYGQIECKWDSVIDLDKMWESLLKITTEGAVFVFFCTTRFGRTLINSKPDMFAYDLVWVKSAPVGWLNCANQPMRQHEMIYIFKRRPRLRRDYKSHPACREYAQQVRLFIGKGTVKQLKKDKVWGKYCHFFGKGWQFSLPSKKNYAVLVDKYKLSDMKGYLTYKQLRDMYGINSYNPQMTKGKPYKTVKGGISKVYDSKKIVATNNKGTRHPTSILKFNQPHKTIHSTQKPVDLCEWLVRSYSKPGDLVLDFCMGSGSTGVACLQSGRRFIGIEKDEHIFKTARKRLHLHAIQKGITLTSTRAGQQL